MVFSSLRFVLIFMPVFFACYYILPASFKNAVLFAGSLIFYFLGTLASPYHFILFVASILLDFYVGIAIERYGKYKKALTALGVIFHLAALCTFKYANFVSGELTKIFSGCEEALNIALPIGISFYTFQGISYLADVCAGKTRAEKSLLRFTVYISMFEQLIAGPIVTYPCVKSDLQKRTVKYTDALYGLGVFIFGLGLKVLLANPLGKLWSRGEAIGFESLSTPLAWMVLAAYSFQIYFDFFGYSLMAVGLGKMLGFSLPQNFDHPYTSLTMTEFWRRWHITLGTWFKEYVYIPLGGNRKGGFRTVLNLFAVWLLTGIWHGAGYNFIVWGLVLFAIILTEKLFTGKYLNKYPLFGRIYMLISVPLTWAIFAVEDMSALKSLFLRLFPFFGQGALSVFKYDYIKYLKQYAVFFAVAILFSTRLPYKLLKRVKSRFVTVLLLLCVLAASIYCMYCGFDDPFLYFRF